MYRKKRVAAYCRVSTDQSDQIHSLTAQRQFFEEYIKDHSDWELIDIYYDEGITGTSTAHREGFNKMISNCERGMIDTVLTKEVSRFARNTVDTLNYTRKLKDLNINVIFMNDSIDTDDKDGELRLTIMASLAQEESRKISERVKWGIRRSMEKGYVWGNGRLLGYTIKEGKLILVPEEAEIVKRIFHEYVYDDKGTCAIAKGLNADGYHSTSGGLFRQDSILNIIKNPKYCGDLLQWRTHSTDFLTKHRVKTTENEKPECSLIELEDTHEDIISKELFEKVYTQFKMHFYREVFSNFEKREATLTTVETFCMEVIYALKRPTVNEFASFLHMSSPNAAYKVNNLVKKGYLKKVQSEDDKREFYLQVTDKYMSYYNISASYVDAKMDKIKARMSDEEWGDFRHVLEVILEELDEDMR